MNRNLTIAVRLREVFLHGTWIANTNYQAQLRDLDWQHATLQMDKLNSIAALTYHINYYLAGLLEAFQTGRLEIRDKYSFDLPPISSQADWDQLVATLIKNAVLFSDAVEQMEDALFDQHFIDEKYGSMLRNIEGVIEHSFYHL